ncbi:hypothetical protein J4E83_008254 [Alternaria metachromatica]|uniref:uncharacterized protein n=1 Tax=Alternaria metachromatica TaxID=283354 RepID=UPI0020C50F4C|nr:uncharacterized protein J4E83_008254 [Alternaria metachromatica]KAI4610640.1 hypothetical protein J4E83_008254 [Alternaria metachromatica]
MEDAPTVAVIGLGPAGIVALKNLREEGFHATGFDRNEHVGGLWQYSEKEQTSVMQTTTVNVSKERSCYTDFPYPDDVPSHPAATQVQQYLTDYSKHFGLEPYMRLSTAIEQITFDDEREKWVVDVKDGGKEYFDKVVVAIGGMVGKANLPVIEGVEKFAGPSVHSQAFKRPADYKGKRVMVVGFSNSAADTSTQLFPRRIKGVPIDHTHNLRLATFQSLIITYFPRLGEFLFDKFLKKLQDQSFNIRPEWRFEPASKVPVVSDTLVPCLEDGSITSVAGIKRIVNATEVELQDGTKVDVDAIIWCTGYKSDFSMIEPRFNPECRPQAWLDAPGSNGKSLFRLYKNVFSLEKPDSLAFMAAVHITISGFKIFDLTTMAIAQAWAGKSSLPSLPDMKLAVDKHHVWLAETAKRVYNLSPGQCETGDWVAAMDGLAGTGVNEYLGYGWKGWLFWLQNRKFCNLLMGGIWSPHIHRVFSTGKRKCWDGAREAIERVNESVAKMRKEEKKKSG